jgi:chromate transporter
MIGAEVWGPSFELAWKLAKLSLVAVGGAHTVMPDVYRFIVVEKQWLQGQEFASLFALGQAAPGPNVLVLAMFGYRITGMPGAIIAPLAFCLPSAILCYFIARADKQGGDAPWKKTVKAGLIPLTVGVIIAAAGILLQTTGSGWLAIALAVTTAALAYKTKLNPLWFIGVGAVLPLLVDF